MHGCNKYWSWPPGSIASLYGERDSPQINFSQNKSWIILWSCNSLLQKIILRINCFNTYEPLKETDPVFWKTSNNPRKTKLLPKKPCVKQPNFRKTQIKINPNQSAKIQWKPKTKSNNRKKIKPVTRSKTRLTNVHERPGIETDRTKNKIQYLNPVSLKPT